MHARGRRKRTEKEQASTCACSYLSVRRIDRGKTGGVQASAAHREKAGPNGEAHARQGKQSKRMGLARTQPGLAMLYLIASL
jgi:hypothetical protein